MSTNIIYDKQFIKVESKFIPMIFAGSSNCYQYDRSNRGRRDRSWFNDTYITDGKKMVTNEELLQRVDDERTRFMEQYPVGSEDEYSDKRFGWYAGLVIGGMGSRTTFGMYKGLYITGMEKALTVEQLLDERVDVVFDMYDYNGTYEAKAAERNIAWFGKTKITSTQHFLETFDRYKNQYEGTGLSWSITFDEWNLEKQMKSIRRKYFPKGEKKHYEYVDVDHYFTVLFKWQDETHYFVKRTRKGIKYTYYPYQKFATIQEANKVKSRLKDHVAIVVERVDKPDRVKVIKK